MMRWRRASLVEVFEYAKTRTMTPGRDGLAGPKWDAQVVPFTDGTAVACRSEWNGPLSEVTPDVDAEPPSWWILEVVP